MERNLSPPVCYQAAIMIFYNYHLNIDQADYYFINMIKQCVINNVYTE